MEGSLWSGRVTAPTAPTRAARASKDKPLMPTAHPLADSLKPRALPDWGMEEGRASVEPPRHVSLYAPRAIYLLWVVWEIDEAVMAMAVMAVRKRNVCAVAGASRLRELLCGICGVVRRTVSTV